jgi:hypothetical protein
MSEGMGLPEGEVAVRLTGFRSAATGRAGVKIDLDLPAAAVRQLLDSGATGAVDGENLRVELEKVELGDGTGPLDVVELLVSLQGR